MILDGAEDSAIEEAAERLRTLRENRNRADYQLDRPEFESEAYAQVQLKDAARLSARSAPVAAHEVPPTADTTKSGKR